MKTSVNATRRDLLGLAAGAAVVAAGASAMTAVAASVESKMVDLAAQWWATHAAIEEVERDDDYDDATLSALVDQTTELEEQMVITVARTTDDAIAALEVARSDMIRFKFNGVPFSDKGDGGDRLALAAIDNALRVLRAVA
jgi:hypothetical protein